METNGSYAQLLQKWKRNARYPYFRSLRARLKCKSAKQNVKFSVFFQTQTQRVSLVQNLSVAAGGITFWKPHWDLGPPAGHTDRQRTCPGRAGRRRAGRRPGPGGPRPSPGAGRGLEQKVSRSRGIKLPLNSNIVDPSNNLSCSLKILHQHSQLCEYYLLMENNK